MKKPKNPASKKKPKPEPITTAAIDLPEIVEKLEDMANMLEINGTNPFKVRAFFNAARSLEALPGDLVDMVNSGELLEVEGIGKSIFAHVDEMLRTGTFQEFETLQAQMPSGLLDMLRISGMGPKKVKAVWDKLEIRNIVELERAAQENRIAGLPGFGEKTQENILKGIENFRRYSERHLLNIALTEAREIHGEISRHPDVQRSLIGGSLRRFRETIKDIDILVSAREADGIMDTFTSLARVSRVIVKGSTKSSVMLKSGINADLRVVTDDEFAFASHYFTGSKQHNTELRGRAKKMGFKLNEYGLFKGDASTPCKDESELFATLGLDYIPPELREATGEIAAAERHELPDLIREEDLKGLFHVHTSYSDGTASIDEMAKGARALGFEYLGITDHSKSAAYAGGLPPAKVKKQAEEIKGLNESTKEFRIFHGIEADILNDGALDYDDDTLGTFDFVVASIHSNFGLSEAAMTARIIKAMENPYTTMLGHPTGRVLLTREGYKVDLNAIIDAAAEYDVIIEINSNPYRLDLDWRFLKTARDRGVKIAIGPDAHSVKGMEDFRYGVGMARKGWLTAGDVVNTRSAGEVETLFGEQGR